MQNTQATTLSKQQASVNQLAAPLLNQLLEQANALELGVSKHESGCTIVDAGIQHDGSTEAGRLIAEICMGGLGHVSLQPDDRFAG
ncbi:MAG TPA: methenyltetrahydromethanopterin cyclohydrolase, partial [Methylotenera sp.]|nr:methenyltetrahydromethanopterin cyclohydrolase [Methylotenera sp.]